MYSLSTSRRASGDADRDTCSAAGSRVILTGFLRTPTVITYPFNASSTSCSLVLPAPSIPSESVYRENPPDTSAIWGILILAKCLVFLLARWLVFLLVRWPILNARGYFNGGKREVLLSSIVLYLAL